MGQRQRPQTDDDVVKDRDHRRDGALEIEPEGDVDENAPEAQQDGLERLPLEVLPDLGAHELDPADLEFAERRLIGERLLDALVDVLGGRPDERQADDVLAWRRRFAG